MRETQVQSLGQEDPPEKGMASHSSTLAWKIPWTEEPGGLQSMGLQMLARDSVTNTLEAVGLWASHVISLCLSFLICKMGTVPAS